MKVRGLKKWMLSKLVVALAVGLLPGAAMAAENAGNNVGDELKEKLKQADVKAQNVKDDITVEASDVIVLNDKHEAEIRINIKGGKEQLQEILENGEVEAVIPDGLILVDDGQLALNKTTDAAGVLLYKGFKWEQKDSQLCQLTLRVKADSRYRADNKEVKFEQLIEGLKVNVKNKTTAKQLLSKQFKVIPRSLQTFDVNEQYVVEYKQDYILLDLELNVNGSGGVLPESVMLLSPVPAGAEIVKASVTDGGVIDQEGKLLWQCKPDQGKLEHKFRYQIKVKRDYDLGLLTTWNRQMKVKLAGSWINWELKKADHDNGNYRFHEQISIKHEGMEHGDNLYLKYALENKDDAEQQLGLILKGLEQWGSVKFFLDADHDGKVTGKDKELSGKFSLKAHEKAWLIIVCAPSQQAAAQQQTDVSLTVTLGSSNTAAYTAETVVNTQNKQEQASSGGQEQKPASLVNTGTSNDDTKPNAKSQLGLTQLPKTGSDVPKALWYLFGFILLGLGAALQWRKSQQK